MSELAFNMNGDPFEIPAGAVAWRVRKMKPKGAPEVAFGRSGAPLVLPIEADLEDLRAEVNAPGKYRLDPIDAANKPCEGAPAGYVYVHELLTPVEQPATPGTQALRALPSASDNVVIEAMRMNAEIARAVVDRFPNMLEAAAVLLRAADGAGLPARPPMATDDQESDGDESEDADEAAGFDINAVLAQLAPLLIAAFGSGKVSVPSLASLLDWRKAQPTRPMPAATPATSAKAANVVGPKSADTTRTEELPPLDPATMQHFVAIQAALTPGEATLARAVAAELAPAQLREWFDELKKLNVPDAAVRIRALIASNGKKGGAL